VPQKDKYKEDKKHLEILANIFLFLAFVSFVFLKDIELTVLGMLVCLIMKQIKETL